MARTTSATKVISPKKKSPTKRVSASKSKSPSPRSPPKNKSPARKKSPVKKTTKKPVKKTSPKSSPKRSPTRAQGGAKDMHAIPYAKLKKAIMEVLGESGRQNYRISEGYIRKLHELLQEDFHRLVPKIVKNAEKQKRKTVKGVDFEGVEYPDKVSIKKLTEDERYHLFGDKKAPVLRDALGHMYSDARIKHLFLKYGGEKVSKDLKEHFVQFLEDLVRHFVNHSLHHIHGTKRKTLKDKDL